MTEQSEETSDRIAKLAAKGLRDPMSLTPEDIQAICGSALTQVEDQPKDDDQP